MDGDREEGGLGKEMERDGGWGCGGRGGRERMERQRQGREKAPGGDGVVLQGQSEQCHFQESHNGALAFPDSLGRALRGHQET